VVEAALVFAASFSSPPHAPKNSTPTRTSTPTRISTTALRITAPFEALTSTTRASIHEHDPGQYPVFVWNVGKGAFLTRISFSR
jgi:hypothetical protein